MELISNQLRIYIKFFKSLFQINKIIVFNEYINTHCISYIKDIKLFICSAFSRWNNIKQNVI